MGLRKLIADLVYEADWEIRGVLSRRVTDISDHRMIDQIKVVDEIIDAVVDDFKLWLDDLPPPTEGDDPRTIVRNYIDGYVQGLER